MQALIDSIADLLRFPGDWLRNLSLLVPLWAAKGLFLLYPIILFIWVVLKDRSEVKGEVQLRKKEVDLRPYAAIALILQVVIYAVF